MLITPFSSDVSHPGKRFKAKSVEKKRGVQKKNLV